MHACVRACVRACVTGGAALASGLQAVVQKYSSAGPSIIVPVCKRQATIPALYVADNQPALISYLVHSMKIDEQWEC